MDAKDTKYDTFGNPCVQQHEYVHRCAYMRSENKREAQYSVLCALVGIFFSIRVHISFVTLKSNSIQY